MSVSEGMSEFRTSCTATAVVSGRHHRRLESHLCVRVSWRQPLDRGLPWLDSPSGPRRPWRPSDAGTRGQRSDRPSTTLVVASRRRAYGPFHGRSQGGALSPWREVATGDGRPRAAAASSRGRAPSVPVTEELVPALGRWPGGTAGR